MRAMSGELEMAAVEAKTEKRETSEAREPGKVVDLPVVPKRR